MARWRTQLAKLGIQEFDFELFRTELPEDVPSSSDDASGRTCLLALYRPMVLSLDSRLIR